jgi:transaldolase
MPVKVAEAAEKELDGEWRSRVGHDYPVELFSGVDEKSVALSKLWNVTQKEKDFVRNLVNEKPSSGEELVARAHEAGLQDLFPKLDKADMDHIATDGKIPTHDRWKDRIQNGELAIDTLLNLAGLASFTADQGKLDDRIKKLIL